MKLTSAARASIRTKIFLVFLTSLSVYVLLVTLFSWRTLDLSTRYQLSQGTKQSSDLLVSGLRTTLDNARNISYNLLQNADIIRWLGEDDGRGNIAATREANRVLIQTYVTFPGIESIYLFDNEGKSVNASHHLSLPRFSDISETTWYARAVERRGGFFLTLNADDTLFSSLGQNNISLIRQILGSNTMQPIGFLILNLNESFIDDTIRDISEKYDTTFYILDENDVSVLRAQEIPDWGGDIPADGVTRRINGEMLFLSRTDIPELGWTVINSTPYRMPLPNALQMILFPALCAVGMYLLGSVYTANLISKPVGELISSMQGVREGRFEPVPPNDRLDEFGQLNENYNIMIGALNAMIQQRVLMEKEKQRYELDILTERFKPHFLYNTLDSISYLVLSGENARAYEAIVALSHYYRIGLSKGQEIVPLHQEVDMIKNYLALQKIRYSNLIDDQYDIAPDAAQVPVLRNVLQPLVENCIYHGIKPSGESGRITIRAWLEDENICISVADDGMGMAPETLAGLDIRAVEQNALSFGLRGTIRRLQLFYSLDNIYEIISAPGQGTSVLLRVPRKKEDAL